MFGYEALAWFCRACRLLLTGASPNQERMPPHYPLPHRNRKNFHCERTYTCRLGRAAYGRTASRRSEAQCEKGSGAVAKKTAGLSLAVATIVSRPVRLSIEQTYGALEPADYAVLRAIREAIPDANKQSPAALVECVRDTLQKAQSKPLLLTDQRALRAKLLGLVLHRRFCGNKLRTARKSILCR